MSPRYWITYAMAKPICARLLGVFVEEAKAAGCRVHKGGAYVCMEGPQFSTRAESEVYRSWGADVIGMTNLQEAKLAREAEICYATLAMVTEALKLSGIDLPEDDRKALVDGANTALTRLEEQRAISIPNDVSPPYHFSPVVAGMTVDKARRPFVVSKAPALKRPGALDDVARGRDELIAAGRRRAARFTTRESGARLAEAYRTCATT